jgi:AAHS family 4-hydroxybenzoate transporter-like MFS transporter
MPRTLLLLALALVCEGFDLQVANFAAPGLMKALGITRGELAPFFSASLVGMLIGAPLLGRYGDRAGRRRVIVGGTVAYALCSLVTAAATTLPALVALRFLTGVALGGVMPNVFALAGEAADERLRTKAVAIIGIGISFGGVLAGSAAAALVAQGWRLLFVIGGVVPLLMAAALWALLPESKAFLAREREVRAPLPALFAGSYRTVTPAIWLVFVLTLMTLYLISAWTPVLLQESVITQRDAAWASTGYQFGAMLGCIATALLIGRRGWGQVAGFAACAAGALALTSWTVGSVGLVTVGLIAAGFFIVGAQNGLNGGTAAAYPTELRATGLGWGLGIGRLGSIAGPFVGGYAAQLGSQPARSVLLVQVLPLLIAAGAAWWLRARAE